MRRESPGRPALIQLSLYFLKLGAVCFGGPVALIEAMQRDLLEERGWVSRQDFVQGLALAKLAPGPMATQLAIYIGCLNDGVLGATLAGLALVLPSFAMAVLLAAIYAQGKGLRWMQALFYGIGAAVLAIVARSAWNLTVRSLGKKRFLWALYLGMALITVSARQESLWLFLLCGIAGMLYYAPPGRLRRFNACGWLPWLGLFAPQGRTPAGWGLLGTVFLFFAKSSAVVYGGGLVIVPFLYGGVVERYHWLTDRQFVDAVAVAMITPGPVVITVAFIGYLVAGLAGAALAAAGVFLPVYLIVIILTPWYRRYGGRPQLSAFAEGVTAAAVGALTGAVFFIAPNAVRDPATAAIAVLSLILLVGFDVPEPLLVLLSGAAGLALFKG